MPYKKFTRDDDNGDFQAADGAWLCYSITEYYAIGHRKVIYLQLHKEPTPYSNPIGVYRQPVAYVDHRDGSRGAVVGLAAQWVAKWYDRGYRHVSVAVDA